MKERLAGALLLGLAVTTPTHAQQLSGRTCGPHRDLIAVLKQRFAEDRRARGLQANGDLLEVFASTGGATWTVVVTKPSRYACIMAAGTYWESGAASTALNIKAP